MTPSIWHHIAAINLSETRAALVVVVDCVGSIPGKPGAMMLVTPTQTVGTVGGGPTEATLIEQAHTSDAPNLIELKHDGTEIDAICSGLQHSLILPLNHALIATAAAIADHLEKGGFGALELTDNTCRFTPDLSPTRRFVHDETSGHFNFEDTIGYPHTLTLIGGGHVSLALSRIMATLPFRIRVLDNRAHLPTMADNQAAHEQYIVNYNQISKHVPESTRQYVVIMTHGHVNDENVLKQLITKKFAYLGMMGSRTKTMRIKERLQQSGIDDSRLSRLHAPIGLPIGSHTPEEIAISIAAEIVQVKNSRAPV